MKKYPGIILAMTTAVMITSCSSVLNGGDTKSTQEGAASESVTTEAQTDAIKIENETDPEPSSETETLSEAETSAPSQESKPGETEAMPVYTVTAVQKTMYVTQPVHVRASYTTKSDVLTSFGTGQKVSVTGQSANGWMRISYKGGDAYIYKKYLSSSKTESETKAAASVPSPENTPTGQNGSNSSNTQNTSAPSGPSVPGGNDNIPIVEPSPLTPSAGTQNTNSTAGPGSSTAPGSSSGAGTGMITSIGPGM
ncbi:SH3 domain-containing protein [Hungatella sp. SB206]|uniref:SH3 domain-containing protein n=1 Tax=Hungatella sp. SB206 TaxID=2937758 RepID=UPI003DA8D5B3